MDFIELDEGVGLHGDGYCDDDANAEECLYDLGDCCSFADPDAFSLCTECYCKVNVTEMTQNINCLDVLEYTLRNPDGVKNGDGICDELINNINHFFDTGDCCIDDPDAFSTCVECYCHVNIFEKIQSNKENECFDFNKEAFDRVAIQFSVDFRSTRKKFFKVSKTQFTLEPQTQDKQLSFKRNHLKALSHGITKNSVTFSEKCSVGILMYEAKHKTQA